MRTKAPFLLVFLLLAACSSRPLVYEEMTEPERADELELHTTLTNTAETIADLAFKFVDEDKRANLAESVIKALKLVQAALESGDPEKFLKTLIDDTLGDIELLGANIGEVAKDAIDLFRGWIDLPNLNEYLPEVIRDRLLAFVRGAIEGLSKHAGP
jgi:hypothetical protein